MYTQHLVNILRTLVQ